jgi:serine protease
MAQCRYVVFAILALLVQLSPPAQAAPRDEEEVPGSLLVRFRKVPRAIAKARLKRDLGYGVYQFSTEDLGRGAAKRLAKLIERDPDIMWAGPELMRSADATAVSINDPRYGEQWALPLIQAPEAWATTRGSSRVVVAVIDSGALDHPELADRYLPGYDFVSDPNNAGDGDGRDPDPRDAGTVSPSSSGLHGLHVTGIIGARPDNGIGIAGVDWNCRILPIRVLGVIRAKGTDSDIADAIRWAVGLPVAGVPNNPTPAQVINMSFGGPGGSELLQEAVNDAVARGAIVISSAGNDATDASTYAPAGLDNVIAVGAVDTNARLAPYSNYGPRVALVAPGGSPLDGETPGILSTTYLPTQANPWDFIRLEGTSQAAPHVAGVVALMRAVAPQLDARVVRQILTVTADPQGQCNEGCGAGLLNAASAVAAAAIRAGCNPLCGPEEACLEGQCVRSGGNGVTVVAGCRATGPSSKGGADKAGDLWGSLLLLGAPLLVALQCYRRRRV